MYEDESFNNILNDNKNKILIEENFNISKDNINITKEN